MNPRPKRKGKRSASIPRIDEDEDEEGRVLTDTSEHEGQLLLLLRQENLESRTSSDEIHDGGVPSSSLEEGEELGSLGSGLRNEAEEEEVSERSLTSVKMDRKKTNLGRVDDSRKGHVFSRVDTSELGDGTGEDKKCISLCLKLVGARPSKGEQRTHVCSATTSLSRSGDLSSSSRRCRRTDANPFSIRTSATLLQDDDRIPKRGQYSLTLRRVKKRTNELLRIEQSRMFERRSLPRQA